MTQTKTQTILPPISKQNYPLMNAKSAPITPRSTQAYTSNSTVHDQNISTQRSNAKRKMQSRRITGPRLPPASRTTLAFNPSFNEFTDPTELTLISRELKQKIINARRELIPYKEEVRRLQYFYNPHMYDPSIQNMNEKKAELEKERCDIEDEMDLNRKACQGSIFSANELQNETLKQDYHERNIILERIESHLDKKKEKLDQILNSQTADDIVEANSQIKKLTRKLKELKEEGDKLYVQNLKKLSTVGSSKTTESQKLKPYQKRLDEERHNVEKKKGELRTMRNQHRKKVDELKNKINEKEEKLKRVEQRDNWRETLKIKQINEDEEDRLYDIEEEEEEFESESTNNKIEDDENRLNEEEEEEAEINEEEEGHNPSENGIRPPKSHSARSPRRTKLNDVINCAKTVINADNKNTNNEEEEEGEKHGKGEEEEEEAEINDEEEEQNDPIDKRDPATTAPVSSNTNKSEEGENDSPLVDAIAQNISTLENDNQQKGQTQPPPKL